MVAFKIRSCNELKTNLNYWKALGPLAQSAERGADNAKVVSSTLTLITTVCLLFSRCHMISKHFKDVCLSFSANASKKTIRAAPESWTQTGYPAWTSLRFLCTFEAVFSVWTEHWTSLNLFIYNNFSHNFVGTNVYRGISSNFRAPA